MSIKREVAKYIVVILMVIAFFEALKVVTGTGVPLAVVEGNSMYPKLNDGDVVLLVGVKPSDLKVGDIIVYKRDGKYIIHKIIRIEVRDGKYYFTTQGENNLLPDYPPVPEDDVVGRVTYRIPLVGIVLQEPFRYVVIVLLIVVLVVLIIKPSAKKREEVAVAK